jgi:acyl CoA:acetate/3-ketoacid CoA transferase alpha subunit
VDVVAANNVEIGAIDPDAVMLPGIFVKLPGAGLGGKR